MKKKLLIVDDNRENRYMLRSLLEGHGYSVTEAHDGAEALELASLSPPDAVVTDLLMPGMDGFALCRAWMADDRLWRKAFIVYTATYTESKDRKLLLDLGADAYLIKPSEPEVLVEVIEEALEKVRPKIERPHTIHDTEFFERYAGRLSEKLNKKLGQLADTNQNRIDYITRCEAILDASPMAIIFFDMERKIRVWNYMAEHLLGYSESEALGQSLDMFLPDDRLVELQQLIGNAEKPMEMFRHEIQWFRKDKQAHDLSTSLTFLGKDIGFVLMLSDFADHKVVESEKKKLEEQLVTSQRMESLGLLSGGVAHDFNNLLTGILYYAEFIQNGLEEGNPLRESAVEIFKAGERAAALTRQLLAFSRQQSLHPEVLELNGIVRDIEEMLRRIIGEHIKLRVDLDENLDRIEADVSHLEQVIVNLATNARDAMPKGGCLTITTGNAVISREDAEANPSLRPGRYVMMKISDTGTGMDERTRTRIFDPFFSTKEPGKGTGLGLATVYGIVKQNRGFISIESEPGKGTAFSIYLPWTKKIIVSGGTVETAVKISTGNETILVVEDNVYVRNVTGLILEKAGYRVIKAADANEALSQMRHEETEIDLLLTDIVMPDINGLELARQFLTMRPGVKVIFTSGYTADVIPYHELHIPGVSLIDKPFTTTTILATIRDVLDGKVAGDISDNVLKYS
ncbi:MAG: response regulator [Chitinispirillaceae bacterium]|nr:response regulator [Chitinispirillaceae bacterium]